MSERCWSCRTELPLADVRHQAGIGWSCLDVTACRIRRDANNYDVVIAQLRADIERLRIARKYDAEAVAATERDLRADLARVTAERNERDAKAGEMTSEARSLRERLADAYRDRDRLKGLLHTEMLCSLHYCETHEMAYQRPEGSTAGCPHCEAERLELDAQSWQDQCIEWKARAAEAERERDDARASLAKVRADLDTMISLHDEVEAQRDEAREEVEHFKAGQDRAFAALDAEMALSAKLRAVVVAARGALHHVIDRGNRAALQAALAALDGAR